MNSPTICNKMRFKQNHLILKTIGNWSNQMEDIRQHVRVTIAANTIAGGNMVQKFSQATMFAASQALLPPR